MDINTQRWSRSKFKNGLNVDLYGTKYYYQDNQLHRLNGPAIEYWNGSKRWYFRDMCHRIDGPAFESINGNKQYWIFGIRVL